VKVGYEASFGKDLRKIQDKSLSQKIKIAINEVKDAKDIRYINSLKKLKGYETFYRIKIGDYRIGIEIVENEIIFTRFLYRRDIYRFFP
jgi:mRNA interferase RelE/StbE